MNKIILLILFIASFQDSRAQLEEMRVYEGKSIYQWTSDDEFETISDELADDIIRKKYNPEYLVCTLILEKDGSFYLYYKDLSFLWCSYVPHRSAKGSYQIKNDTLILNSKLRMDETYSIHFDTSSVKENNKKLLILNSDRDYEYNIKTNTEDYHTLNKGDSVWISNKTKKIEVSTSCYNKRFIIPVESTSDKNKISIDLIFNGSSDLSIENCRFLMKRKKLIMLDSFYFIDIEDNIFKKKKLKRKAK